MRGTEFGLADIMLNKNQINLLHGAYYLVEEMEIYLIIKQICVEL